jgi:hypothetical protein
MIILKGITSYKHLNKILVEIVKEAENPISSSSINDYLFNHYKTSKLNISSYAISQRLKGHPEIISTRTKRGFLLYSYKTTPF